MEPLKPAGWVAASGRSKSQAPPTDPGQQRVEAEQSRDESDPPQTQPKRPANPSPGDAWGLRKSGSGQTSFLAGKQNYRFWIPLVDSRGTRSTSGEPHLPEGWHLEAELFKRTDAKLPPARRHVRTLNCLHYPVGGLFFSRRWRSLAGV
jgi:hypothetical protein